jgi:hypothetical protein
MNEVRVVATPTPVMPTFGALVRMQRKTILVAVAMAIAALWVFFALGRFPVGLTLAIGVGLGLLNHLATEWWLAKIVTSNEQFTRSQLTRATLARLTVLTVAALGIAIAFWPNGIGILLGLAIFRLIALVMTSIPLLKELKSA